MKRLFSPCTRLRDIFTRQGFDPPEGLQELNLDVSTEAFLSSKLGMTYADLYAMLGNGNTIAWMAPHAASLMPANGGLAAVALEGDSVVYSLAQLYTSSRFCFTVDGKEIVAFADSPEHLLEICNVVIRLLAGSVVHSVLLYKWSSRDCAWINAATLAYLMEQCQSMKVLTLSDLALDETQCCVLGTYSRPDLEIILDNCRVTGDGASALTKVLGCNQGPTKLALFDINFSVLANGLVGNSRLKSLTAGHLSVYFGVHRQEFLAIASALRENRGLVDLNIRYHFMMSNDTWDTICDSLKRHPTLEVLSLRQSTGIHAESPLAPAVLKSRIQTLVDMVKVNTTIHTMNLNGCYRDDELFQKSVIPYLETNWLRPRLLAIQRTRPLSYRTKVLGRALLSVRTDPNRFWMLLSGNVDIVFPVTTTAYTPAMRLRVF